MLSAAQYRLHCEEKMKKDKASGADGDSVRDRERGRKAEGERGEERGSVM